RRHTRSKRDWSSDVCSSDLFPVDFIYCKILVQLIIEYLMRFSMFISRLLWTDDGTEVKLRIHIFMNRNGAIRIAFAFQIDFHARSEERRVGKECRCGCARCY